MARLIDAELLLEDNTWEWFDEWGNYTSAGHAIADAPTVDAVEVVHGEWISLTDCSNAGVYCSVCKKKVWKEDYAWCNRKNKLRSNYCPNCGAKMDGDTE